MCGGLVEIDKEMQQVVNEEEGRRIWKGLKWAVRKVQAGGEESFNSQEIKAVFWSLECVVSGSFLICKEI